MPGRIVELEALAAALPEQGRVIGLDLGSKTIGLALSDVGRAIASPLGTIARTKFTKDAEHLLGLIRQHGIVAVVIGLPRNMDGSEGRAAQSARSFGRNLHHAERIQVKIAEQAMAREDRAERQFGFRRDQML